jgi:hypothetical protein
MREKRQDRPRPDLLVRLALLALVALSACGKPMWRSPLPVLSDEPLARGQPVEAGIYALLLGEEEKFVLLAETTLVIVSGQHDPPILDPADSHLIARRWPDSVKAGFASAFADCNQRGRQPHSVSPLALAHPYVARAGSSSFKCMELRTPECDRISAVVWLSPLGFNADSTYAVAYKRTWCGGGLCGHGAAFLFRRRPDKQWTLWMAHTLWTS